MAPRPVRDVILGGVFLHLTLGTLYSWGCIAPYVTSYIRLYDSEATLTDTSIVYASACLGHSLTAPFVGLLQDKRRLGLRATAAVGASLVSGATLASSMATTVTGLSALNSVFGIGVALAYTCPLVSGYAWLPERKGMVSGFVVAGFGAGAAVFDVVATAVVNPKDVPPEASTGYYGQSFTLHRSSRHGARTYSHGSLSSRNGKNRCLRAQEVAGRVPLMYLVLGSCYLVLGLIGSWMIANPPGVDGKGLPSESYTSLATNEVLGSPAGSNHSGISSADSPLLESKPLPVHYHGGDDEKCHVEPAGVIAGASAGGQDQQASADVLPGGGSSPVVTAATYPLSLADRGGGEVTRSQWLEQPQGGKPEDSMFERTMSWEAAEIEAVGGGGGHRQEAGDKSADAEAEPAAGERGGQRELQVWSLLRESDFYHLALTMLCTGVSGLFIAGNYKGIARDIFPNADRFLSILGSVASLFNASGRILGGLSVDRFGCFATLVAQAGSATCVLLVLRLASDDSRPVFFLAICLMHSLYGSNFAIYPTLTAEFFGVTTAGPNYGLVFCVFGLGSFLTMLWLAAGARPSGQVFLTCAGLSLAGAASATLLWARRRHRSDKL